MLQQLKNHEVLFNLDNSIMLQIINLISSQIQAGDGKSWPLVKAMKTFSLALACHICMTFILEIVQHSLCLMTCVIIIMYKISRSNSISS